MTSSIGFLLVGRAAWACGVVVTGAKSILVMNAERAPVARRRCCASSGDTGSPAPPPPDDDCRFFLRHKATPRRQ